MKELGLFYSFIVFLFAFGVFFSLFSTFQFQKFPKDQLLLVLSGEYLILSFLFGRFNKSSFVLFNSLSGNVARMVEKMLVFLPFLILFLVYYGNFWEIIPLLGIFMLTLLSFSQIKPPNKNRILKIKNISVFRKIENRSEIRRGSQVLILLFIAIVFGVSLYEKNAMLSIVCLYFLSLMFLLYQFAIEPKYFLWNVCINVPKYLTNVILLAIRDFLLLLSPFLFLAGAIFWNTPDFFMFLLIHFSLSLLGIVNLMFIKYAFYPNSFIIQITGALYIAFSILALMNPLYGFLSLLSLFYLSVHPL